MMRTRLMADGLLYELHHKGIRRSAMAQSIKEKIWLFCDANRHSTERDMAQCVARLYRYIGHNDEAMKVATAAANADQINKARMRA
jgi:hypothetical protein